MFKNKNLYVYVYNKNKEEYTIYEYQLTLITIINWLITTGDLLFDKVMKSLINEFNYFSAGSKIGDRIIHPLD